MLSNAWKDNNDNNQITFISYNYLGGVKPGAPIITYNLTYFARAEIGLM